MDLMARSGRLARRWGIWFDRNFRGCAPAPAGLSAAVFGAVAGHALACIYWPEPVGYVLVCGGAIGVGALALWLLPKLLRRLVGCGLLWLLASALLVGSLLYVVKEGAGEGWSWRVFLFSGAAALVLWLFAASWWGLLRRRVYTATTLCTALISAAGTLLLGLFLFTDGFDNHYIHRYLALSDLGDAAQESLQASLSPGPWEAVSLDYGPEGELQAGTVDLTRYMSRADESLTDHYVEAYWDYDLDAVPLRGRVWYPAGGKSCPVLFLAHGNHTITTESYLGYDYLGAYLASHGYVVVSVDQNACNMLTGENDGRAVLLLEHIRLCLDYNQMEGSPLCGVMDQENLAIAGHSRGGEMVATAYLFNGYDRYPENGAITFDYNFSIRSIIAIAPTVNQYRPSGHSVELEDVNYLLLHGAADRDVTSFMGMTQYENISFSGQGDYLKSALYIAGANHGQFNSLWGEYDASGPFTTLFNPESLISAGEQQRIAQLFIKVFLDVTLRGDDSCRSLLTDWDDYAAQLPRTVYAQCYETSAFVAIADFEEDSDLTAGTMEGVSLRAEGTNLWAEELMNFADGTSHDTHALRLRWGEESRYVLRLPRVDLREAALVFDICDLDSAAVEEGRLALVDGLVTVEDAWGRRASARIGGAATVYPILPVRTDKLDFLFGTCTFKKAFSTVSLPTRAFIPEGEEPDWSAIAEICFTFEPSGEIALDNIGLEKPGS